MYCNLVHLPHVPARSVSSARWLARAPLSLRVAAVSPAWFVGFGFLAMVGGAGVRSGGISGEVGKESERHHRHHHHHRHITSHSRGTTATVTITTTVIPPSHRRATAARAAHLPPHHSPESHSFRFRLRGRLAAGRSQERALRRLDAHGRAGAPGGGGGRAASGRRLWRTVVPQKERGQLSGLCLGSVPTGRTRHNPWEGIWGGERGSDI
jgi:hypothetical protein